LLDAIRGRIKPTNATLAWFDSRDALVNYLNQGHDRSLVKIERLEFFGHSNRNCWMFDYSNRFDAAGIENGILHITQLSYIRNDVFAPFAYCKSWGCHSGEAYSQSWRQRFGVYLIGAVGKTDYSQGGLPFLSSENGRWAQ
jgi:hypothetical protein